MLSQLAANFAGVGQQASQLGIICFGVIQIIAGEMTMGALIAAVILSGRTLAPLAQIGSLFGRIHGARMAYKQVDEFMKQNSQEEDAKDYSREIPFSNVNFRYPDQTETRCRTSISISSRAKRS